MACSVSCARTDISEQITMSGIAWECCPILAKPAHAVGPKLKARSLYQNGIWQARMVAEVSREKCHKQT
jgi:hypothetical protein